MADEIAESNVIGDETAPGEELVIPEEKKSSSNIILLGIAALIAWKLFFSK